MVENRSFIVSVLCEYSQLIYVFNGSTFLHYQLQVSNILHIFAMPNISSSSNYTFTLKFSLILLWQGNHHDCHCKICDPIIQLSSGEWVRWSPLSRSLIWPIGLLTLIYCFVKRKTSIVVHTQLRRYERSMVWTKEEIECCSAIEHSFPDLIYPQHTNTH